jgi:hypothetical protein
MLNVWLDHHSQRPAQTARLQSSYRYEEPLSNALTSPRRCTI